MFEGLDEWEVPYDDFVLELDEGAYAQYKFVKTFAKISNVSL